MRRRESPLTEAMAINDDAKARAEAAESRFGSIVDADYLCKCAISLREIVEAKV